MTTTEPNHFQVTEETVVAPQPWMQMQHVAGVHVEAKAKSFDPTSGFNKAETLQVLETSITNTAPVRQWVYGLVTRGGSRVTLTCRSRGYISTRHAMVITSETPAYNMIEVSRFGCGSDVGAGGILKIGGEYAINELRQNTVTMPFMPHQTKWFMLEPGETLHAKIDTRFISERWENSLINGGDGDTESTVVAGDLRLDLFSVPTLMHEVGRTIPEIVGGSSNVKYGRGVDYIFLNTTVTVPKPADLQEGDILLAIQCNQFGLSSDLYPANSSWMLMHSRNEGLFGWEDVHMKVWGRNVDGTEPANFVWTNGWLAEETVVIIPIRGAVPLSSIAALEGWHIASNLSRWLLVEEQMAPSINRSGQLLLSASFFAHTLLQTPIHQRQPSGMTEILDTAGDMSTLAIAAQASPPTPTLDRHWVPDKIPFFTGHSITASILIPGLQVFEEESY